MIWVFLAACFAGVLMGFVLRAGALLLFSAMAAIAGFVYVALHGYPVLGATLAGFGLMATIQLSYLLGLWLNVAWPERWRLRNFGGDHRSAALYLLVCNCGFNGLQG